ncbi:putative pks-nrps protein [Phaeomoniella chlamydospora]|uniref:Putative pks-nrps protein n=1 Tax=Phaeomoniella chlamydospora TaxID=158046 RepID=A0A0G2ETN0_PHACM|nr:putative pks-nrps protein [Phaeomoniella chlamydospora]
MMKEPIAVVGSACRFPGGADSPSKLWDLLRDPRDVLGEFPVEGKDTLDRLNLSNFHNVNGEHHGSTDVKDKSYLLSEDIRLFDASFFSISPLEADGLDPQQRLLLETVYEAFESAGCTLQQVQGSQTSVFAGLMTADYYDVQLRDTETLPRYNLTGTARSFVSNRISYFFDLKGESMTIDTACSSSLVALHQAVQSLRSGHSTASIVAGSNVILDPPMYIAESNLHMLSPTSRSRMWDRSADGYARGEGIAAMYLKTLSQALKDGDHIECVVRETAINSDGRTKGITMPSSEAQSALIRQTYRNAGLDPLTDRPQYFECHGTGTLAGDPVEARAIKEAFFPGNSIGNFDVEKLFVGSIKTVVGHSEGAAGLAAVMKVSLALQNKTIPPNMHFFELNPAIEPFYDRLEVATKAMPWPTRSGCPLRASVNSFGLGGTNAHAIIECYNPSVQQSAGIHEAQSSNDTFVGPLTFSAKSSSSLTATVRDHLEYIKEHPETNLRDLTSILQTKRNDFPFKTFFSGATSQRLLDFMEKYVQSADGGLGGDVGAQGSANNSNEIPGTLGIFTGQGAQWPSMSRGLIETCRLFRESIDLCEASLAALPAADTPDWSLRKELLKDESSSRLSEAALSQPLCTAVQIGMVDLLRAAGIKLDAVVGHSSGEIAAAYAAGYLSAHDAIRIAYYRGFHARLAAGENGKPGAMMAAGLSFEDALSLCAERPFAGRISVAASNSTTIVTLSGDKDAINEAKNLFDEKKTFSRLLNVDTAYHSHHMLPCADPYLQSLKACNIQIKEPRSDCVWVSSVYEDREALEETLCDDLTGKYWVDNMIKPVLFSQAVEYSLWNGGPFNVAVEMGPHPALKGPATQTIKSATGATIPYANFMRRGDHELEAFSGGVGYVWSHLGPSYVDFSGYRRAFDEPGSPEPKLLKNLPTYAWDHKKPHWRESRISRNYRLRNHGAHELLGRRVFDDSSYEMRWRNILRLSELPWLRGHDFQGQVLFPGAAYVAMALEAARAIASGRSIKLIEVKDMSILRALTIDEHHPGVETMFTVKFVGQDVRVRDDAMLEADFACYVCTDDTSSLETRCLGRIVLHLGASSVNDLPPRAQERSDLVPLDVDRWAASLVNVGLNYTGLFKGITTGKRTMNHATATASWLEVDVGNEFLIHPGILDVGFQTMFAAHCSPASGTLWSPYLPVKMGRLVMNPNINYQTSFGELKYEFDAFITGSSINSLVGDLNYYDAQNKTGIQIEGLVLRSFSEWKPTNDRLLFSKTEWDIDVNGGFETLLEKGKDFGDIELVEAIERTALYYFRTLMDAISPSEIQGFRWHFQKFLEAVDVCLSQVRSGEHPVVQTEWQKDTRDDIMQMKERFPGQIDLQLAHSIGENLVKVVRGEEQMLEIMLEDDMLNRLYMEGCGFSELNWYIGQVVKRIAYKYPRMKVFEIGAGTGGTTRSVLDAIGSTYSSWTYTDISSGFFEKASEKFKDHKGKFNFKVLDIEKDILEQGFETEGYDMIIAANVLHATRNMSNTLQHTRSLLKPGGFLVLMEVTGDLLRLPFLMGGLPGWWLGYDEGRIRGPGISPVEWNDLLQATGFSGVEHVIHDVPDPIKHSCSVIVSQAVDETFSMLREPLASSHLIPQEDHLLLIGGKTLSISKVVNESKRLLSIWNGRMTVVNTIDDLGRNPLPPRVSVISLTDLDKPIFSDYTSSSRLAILQDLFSKCKNVLWITSGRLAKDPYANMMVGLGRALRSEMPQMNLQFLDFANRSEINSRTIVNAFLRLVVLNSTGYKDDKLLWTQEHEIVLRGEEVLIPRIMLDETINNRFNATKRLVTKTVSPGTKDIELASEKDTYILVDANPLSTRKSASGRIELSLQYSVALTSGPTGQYVLGFGTETETSKQMLAIFESHKSSVQILPSNTYTLDKPESCDAKIIQNVATKLLARAFLFNINSRGSLLVYDAEESLAEAISCLAELTAQPVTFATSKQDSIKDGWILIHPIASVRTIKNILPADITSLLTFTTSDYSKIQRCLPQDCEVRLLDTPLLGHLISTFSGGKLLYDAYTEATNDPPHNDSQINGGIIRLSDISGTSIHDTFYPRVIDWTQRDNLVAHVRPLQTNDLFSSAKTYFMVGLTGELGQSLCRWMINNGARYIVLASRNASVGLRWLEEMRALGAIIKVYKLDVTSRESIHLVYEDIVKILPPIAGVCNGAMVLSDKLFIDMNAETLNNTLQPKVDGTKYLDELFSHASLDFFILFSSLATVVGNGGQSNYHAANMFMESLAAQRRERGLSASVISIGMVVDVGYVQRAGRKIEDHLRKLFYRPLSESDVHHLFAEAVLTSSPDSKRNEIIHLGLQPFVDSPDAKSRPPWYSNARFSHLISEEAALEEQSQSTSKTQNINEQLESASSEEAACSILLAAFAAKLEAIMQLTAGSVDVKIPLLDLGIDSLLAVEIRTWFLKEAHVAVPVLRLLSGDSATEICSEAIKKYLGSKIGKTTNIARDSATKAEPVDVVEDTGATNAESATTSSNEQSGMQTSDSDSEPTKSNSSVSSDPQENREIKETDLLKPVSPSSMKRVGKMSYAQSRMWFLRNYIKDPTFFNIAVAYDIKGNLQVPRLKRALETVLTHHEALRTCFFARPGTGELLQGVLDLHPNLLKHVQAPKEEDFEREFHELKYHDWKLEQGETFRATLLSRGPNFHTIIFGYHHISIDAISLRIFLRDLNPAYQMRPLKPIGKEYLDFATAQAKAVENGEFEEELQFWKKELSPLPDVLPLLPFSRIKARKATENYNCHTATREIDASIVSGIKTASRTLKITPFHFHLATLQVLFSKLTDAQDFCIGIADANRTEESFAETVGFFLNLLPLRFQVNKDKFFRDIAKRTATKAFAALEKSSVPLDLVLDSLDVPRSSSFTPLFQVAFNYRMGQGDMMQTPLGDCQLQLNRVEDAKNTYDLAFNVLQSPTGSCILEVTSRDYLYSPEAAKLVLDVYVNLLKELSSNTSLRVGEAPLFGANDTNMQLIDTGCGQQRQFDWPGTLTQRFDDICAKHPNDIAVRYGGVSLTYSGLASKSLSIAATLLDIDVKPGSRVAVLCEPSSDTVASLLAILRVGCVYVPLDQSLPKARQAAMLESCKAAVLLCHGPTLSAASDLSYSEGVIINVQDVEIHHSRQVDRLDSGDSPAFLLYTSGSTGTPKGTLLAQRGFINYLASKAERLSLGQEVVLQQSSTGFDMSIAQIFNALGHGGALIMVPQSMRGDPVAITQLMLQERVTFTIGTPSEYLMLLRYGNEYLRRYSAWRHCCLGGEAVTKQLKDAFRLLEAPQLVLTNCYGPTEISAATSFETVDLGASDDIASDDYTPVGKAIPNTSIFIVDDAGKAVPVGFPGEICVSGVGVALEYWTSPELTKAKFTESPFDSYEDSILGYTKMYKTGDKGRLLEDGTLLYMGRQDGDTSIKLRGLRIDLDDVANAIVQTADGVLSDAVVTVRGDPQFLVAHVVPAPGQHPSGSELRLLVKKLPLPQYMCPAVLVTLHRLPFSLNGKVDRKVLQSLELPDTDLEEKSHDRLTLPEAELKLLWENLLQQLNLEQCLGPDSDFFMGAIKENMGVTLPLLDLYQNCTLSKMADRVTSLKGQQPKRKALDWDAEACIPLSMLDDLRRKQGKNVKDHDIEVLLTGSTSFLGGSILRALIENTSIRKVHCIAVLPESEYRLPKSEKLVIYTGSLFNTALGLTQIDHSKLQSSVDLIIHAGAAGHCLNNYSSLNVPNVHSTKFLTALALPRRIPVHYISSGRVTLLSGKTMLSPGSVSSYLPAIDGSEGFTATKWTSERFLENVSRKGSDLDISIHRPCAVVGDEAPNEDALNALIRYSVIMRTVPRFENFEGYFDFEDVNVVAKKIIDDALPQSSTLTSDTATADNPRTLKFRHHSSGKKVPVGGFRGHLEGIHGGGFQEVDLSEWVEMARLHGIEEVIASYVMAVVEKGQKYSFPYMGQTEP